MGEQTGIEWTDHTFNPWWGCVRVSPACEHCYAETFAKRFGVEWGVKAERRPASEKYWRLPVRWNLSADRAGVRRRVFCASMADVFEDRRDLDELRMRLFMLIEATPRLDWQLLTKRPEHVMDMLPSGWRSDRGFRGIPHNVWIGTTVENQRRAEERVPELLKIPARVHFLSCEPLLGPVDVSAWLGHGDVGWVIAGGESGPGARRPDAAWFRSLRDQCAAAGVPFFFKQWGEYDEAGWKSGKKLAGSELDGVEHKAFPGGPP